MNIFRIALRNIQGNGVKSLTVFLIVLGVAAFFVSLTLLVGGSRGSLDKGLQRLGADIVVMPAGSESRVENALLMGKPTRAWMPAVTLLQAAKLDGVAAVSPQIYLQSLLNAHCCAVSEMFMVVFDPASDFTVTPWLKQNLGRELRTGEVIGGTYIFLPEGEKYIRLYGFDLDLVGKLEPTGMGLDQTMFMTSETARVLALSSLTTAVSPLEIPQGQISSILVKVTPEANAHAVALRIEKGLQGTVAIESPNLFGAFRQQVLGLLSSFAVLTILAWAISAVVIGLVFSMATHERRRELAVLQAIGFNRFRIFRAFWTEALILGGSGALVGILLASGLIYYFRDFISGSLAMPFLFPSLASWFTQAALALGISLLMVSAAVFLPAYRISRQEPAAAMRE